MAKITNIRAALETRLVSLTPKWPIALDNVNYKPVTGKKWMRATLLPAQTQAYLGTNAGEKWHGDFVVSVFAPTNKGAGEAERRAEEILAHFPKGLSVNSGGVYVVCGQPYVNKGYPESGWYSQIVYVPWHSFII